MRHARGFVLDNGNVPGGAAMLLTSAYFYYPEYELSAIIYGKMVNLKNFPVRPIRKEGSIVMRQTAILIMLIFLSLYTLVFTEQAFAYLDPGSGSMMLQLLFGGVAGVAVIIKIYWKSFVNLFRHRHGQKENLPSQERDL